MSQAFFITSSLTLHEWGMAVKLQHVQFVTFSFLFLSCFYCNRMFSICFSLLLKIILLFWIIYNIITFLNQANFFLYEGQNQWNCNMGSYMSITVLATHGKCFFPVDVIQVMIIGFKAYAFWLSVQSTYLLLLWFVMSVITISTELQQLVLAGSFRITCHILYIHIFPTKVNDFAIKYLGDLLSGVRVDCLGYFYQTCVI